MMIAGTRWRADGQGRSRGIVGAVVVVAVIGLVGACTEDDPGPRASTATVDSAEALRERNIAEAKATVEAYAAAENVNANNGFENWKSELSPYLTGDALESLVGDYEGIEREGSYTVGGGKIEKLLVVEYLDDPKDAGLEQVSLRACIDTSGVEIFDADGPVTADSESLRRFWTNFLLEHRGADGVWLISVYEWTDEAC